MIPDGIATSVFPRVERRINDVGIYFDPWQRGLGTVALGCRADGKYAATIGGVVESIPRQVAKTFTTASILIGLSLEFPGLRVAWTSHHNRTTTNTFRKISGMVRRKQIWPHIQAIRQTNGEQEISFVNGSIMMFGAREQGFGRGMDEIDIEVFDEAQILSLKALEDMVPATNQARHKHGGLIFFLGTPPRPTDPGEAFTAKREQAITGKSTNMVYVEISADPDADCDDRSQWRKMNPSYPHRTPLESMLRMRENIPDDDSWRREAMGIWPANAGGLISMEQWMALADVKSAPLDPVSFGVYVNKLQTAGAIGVAGYRADGLIHVGVVTTLPGMGWIPGRATELHEKWAPCATVIDERSEAGSLITEIRDSGVPVDVTSAVDMAHACSSFYRAVTDEEIKADGKPGHIRHGGAEPLLRSVVSGKKRDLADAWAWDRKDPASDITELVAVTLALHGLLKYGRPQQETEVWGFWE